MSVFIVAEAGVNHLGDRAKMLALCDAALAAGADAVKFQAFKWGQLRARRNICDEDTLRLLRDSQLTDADLDAIAAHCKAIGIKWFASVFDPSQVERVLSRGACCLKIGHAEAGWDELLRACTDGGGGDTPVYISNPPWEFIDEPCVGRIKCTAEYPAVSPPQLYNVNGTAWYGFSSHYQDYRIPAAAALRGAEYIEFHIATEPGQPEAAWSLMPDDAKRCCELIRLYEQWL